MKPCWGSVNNLIMDVCWTSLFFGPIFSFHVRSIRWVEIV